MRAVRLGVLQEEQKRAVRQRIQHKEKGEILNFHPVLHEKS